ncbi:MAG: deoxyribonuclease IV [Chloroflexi bacterium]|nr:deoxyribonuclease IV [Chloroflexota bacterium]
MKIGAHVSAAGSLDKAIDNAQRIGAECIQIFASGPTNWHVKNHSPKELQAYKEKAARTGIGPCVLHGVYLINFGSPNPDLVAKGIESLLQYQRVAGNIGAMGTIFHIGSHKGQSFEKVLPQVAAAFHKVLDAMPKDVSLIIENSAGMGNSIGATFAEIGAVIKEVGDPRVKVCLDTQHSFANGYDVATKDGLNRVMEELEKEVGAKKLVAVHANDSKCPLGGGLDRHDNIGEGPIGMKGFANIMKHPAFKDVPFYLEVPGFDGEGPDAKNIERLKGLR